MELIHIRQKFDASCIPDVACETRAEIAKTGVSFRPGERIAIAVGSRGIASLPEIVLSAVQAVKEGGAVPFIIPAMGSHGGATAEGQRDVLSGYGIDEKSMGCDVISSLEVVTLPGTMPRTYIARDALEADGVIVINRVKPHTDFHGPIESGLMKMLVIGLGKHAQALEIHRMGVPGLRDLIGIAARRVLATGKIRLGIGAIENAYDKIACVRACRAEEMEGTDSALLALARAKMPSLPMDALDLLIVDRIGKDISGTGLDTNIIGRMRIPSEKEPETPRIGMIIADSLTPASHGNALGVGLCDIITKRLYQDIDLSATTENVVTSGFLERGRIPVVAADLPEAERWALRALHLAPEAASIARIRSTLELTELWVSRPALDALRQSAAFDARGIELVQE